MHLYCFEQEGGNFVGNFGEDIRRRREEKHMTIEDLSQKTKISVVVLRDIENGEFDRYKGDEAYVKMYLKKISNVLDMNIDMLTQQYVELTKEIELAELQEKKDQSMHNQEVVKKRKKFSFEVPKLARKPSVYEDKSHVTIIRIGIILVLVCLIIVVIWYGLYSTHSKDSDSSFNTPNTTVVEGEVETDNSDDSTSEEEEPSETDESSIEIVRNDLLDFSFTLPEGTETFTFKIEFANKSWAEMTVNGEAYDGFKSNIYHNYDEDEYDVVELEFNVDDFEYLVLKNGYSVGHCYYINDQELPLTDEDSTPGITYLTLTLEKE